MRKLTIITIAILFVSVGFLCGCPEFEGDLGEALEGEYVSVSVYAYADVVNTSGTPLTGVKVTFDLMKTGGKDFSYTQDIWDGRAVCPYVGYNLHEGEFIWVSAYIVGGGDSISLTYEDAKKNAKDIGNNVWSYQWEPHFNLVV